MPIDAAASHCVREMASIEPRQISVANELALSVSAIAATSVAGSLIGMNSVIRKNQRKSCISSGVPCSTST